MPKPPLVNCAPAKTPTATIEQVLEHYGLRILFKRAGNLLTGPCPFHKKSGLTDFRVNLGKDTWNCFGECAHGGNVLTFIAILENVDIITAEIRALEYFKPEM